MRFLSGLLTLRLLLLMAGRRRRRLLYHQFERRARWKAPAPSSCPRAGRIEIATRLESEGIIANRWLFIAAI